MENGGASYILAGNKSFCNYCPGYCCYRLPGSSLLLTGDDINRIARHFAITDGEVRQKYLENKNTFRTREDGSCLFLSPGKICKRCSIHEARPRQCRDFPYDRPCPYLENEGLLEILQPRIEQSINDNSSFEPRVL
ncbi:MAG: YkgJ family cysteine cluster protein [Desulfobulbus sp.]